MLFYRDNKLSIMLYGFICNGLYLLFFWTNWTVVGQINLFRGDNNESIGIF